MQENEKRGSAGLALKAGFWYVISTFLVKGLSFITTPVFSRLMNENDYGEFSNFASWEVTLLIIAGAELYNTISRAYYDFTEDFDKYVSSITVASCGVTGILYLLALASGDWIYNIISIPKQYIHILFFTLLFQSCKQIYMTKERTLYRYKSVAAISVFNLLIPTLIAVLMVVLANDSQRLSARIYGFYLPSALIGLGCAIVILRKGKSFNWKYCKYAFRLSLPLIVHYLTAHLLTSSNTIVTKNVLGAEAVAIVSIASSANHILTILLQAVSGAVTTWLMDNLQQRNIKAVRRGTLAYVGGISAVAVGVILLAPEVIWILGGTKYAASITLMPGMVVSVLIQSITTLFTIILTYQKRVVKTALYTTIVSILCVASKIFLLPIFGVQALPFINIVAFGILFLINYWLVRKAGYTAFIHFKGILGIIFAVCLIMLGSYFLYAHTVIRYGVIVAIALAALVIMYKYRQLLIKLIKSKFKKKKEKKENTEE